MTQNALRGGRVLVWSLYVFNLGYKHCVTHLRTRYVLYGYVFVYSQIIDFCLCVCVCVCFSQFHHFDKISTESRDLFGTRLPSLTDTFAQLQLQRLTFSTNITHWCVHQKLFKLSISWSSFISIISSVLSSIPAIVVGVWNPSLLLLECSWSQRPSLGSETVFPRRQRRTEA